MNLKINKKMINHYLEYHLILIIGCLLLSYASLYTTLSFIHKFKEEEKINFFIEGQYIKDETLQNDLISSIEGLEEINYHIASSLSSDLITLYEGYFSTSDIYILREQDFIDMSEVIKDKFIPLDTHFINRINAGVNYNDYNYFTYENINYAFKIYDKENENFNNTLGFINFIEFDKDLDNYYIAFNKESIKFDRLIENKNKIVSTGLDTINYMLRRYINE